MSATERRAITALASITLAAALAATILTIAIGRQERECPWKPSITGTRGEHEHAIPCFENGVVGDVEYLVR